MSRLRQDKAFTLLELLVSISLMLILVGAAISIFITSTNILSSSESRMMIYLNATASFDIIAKDLINSPSGDDSTFEIRNPDNNDDKQVVMRFAATTSWLNSNSEDQEPVTGDVQVIYYLKKKSNNKWVLKRQISEPDGDTFPPLDEDNPLTHTYDTLCEFIKEENGVPGLKVDYLLYDDANKRWDLVEPAPGQLTEFGITLPPDPPGEKLPPGFRLIVNISDDKEVEKQRKVRTLSRYFLINSNNKE